MKRVVTAIIAITTLIAGCSTSDDASFCDLEDDWNTFVTTNLVALTPAELENSLEEVEDLLDRMVDLAPEDIEDDVQRFSEGIEAGIVIYRDAGYDLTRIDPETATGYAAEHEVETQQAEAAIVAWTTANCP